VDVEAAIRTLEASGDYRVLRRFQPARSYGTAMGEVRRALAVDVETTGLDPATEQIIEFAAVRFGYCSLTGTVVEVEPPQNWLEDPGRPIPKPVVSLTGIDDAMVAGQRLDEEAIARLAEPCTLIIAHNAGFDRKFVDRRLPLLGERPWACSLRDVPWRDAGGGSGALDYLVLKHCGMFFDAHRAGADCEALVRLLATPLPDGRLPMRHLLDTLERPMVRLWAIDAPFDMKDQLKARRYRWNGGTDGRPRAWYRELPEAELAREEEWLFANVYGRRVKLPVEPIAATRRFAD
jgi:DNA polymerase-3 subunit epsilon